MHQSIVILDRLAVDLATDLHARFGETAAIEAAARASESRERGNVHHFCRWRTVERLVDYLAGPDGAATRH